MPSVLVLVYLFYGLAFFTVGLSVAVESRRASALAFGRHIRWLGAFGLVHSLVVWLEMCLYLEPAGQWDQIATAVHSLLLPCSALLLVRFGIGLIEDAVPSLPGWLEFAPIVLIVPAGLVFAYALVLVFDNPLHAAATAEMWSRYLLYFPGSALTGIGFVYQWRAVDRLGLSHARRWLLFTALAFFANAIVAGLVLQSMAGLPMPVWRFCIAVAIAICVLRALDIFRAEREQQVKAMQAEHERTQATLLAAQKEARVTAEHWIHTLVRVNQEIAELNNVDRVLTLVVKHARSLLHADIASLALWDAERNELMVKVYAVADRCESGLEIPVRSEILRQAASANSSTPGPIVPFLTTPLHCAILKEDMQAMASMPLRIDSEPLGALWIMRRDAIPFDEDELTGLTQLASQAVIAIEHALMAERLQSLAVTEERGRIAREMHDGLAQILGFLSLEMQTLEALTRQGNQPALLTELGAARERIKEAQADVRDNILSLRTTLGDSAGLVSALDQYLEEFSVQANVPVRLVNDLKGEPHLSPLAETQLVRIIQEALANVRKHAHAQQVEVRLARTDGHLDVTVADDGVGLQRTTDDRASARVRHYGLQTMQERAASVGGTLVIDSEPGGGTRVLARLPLVDR